jgi:hypothetical protein
MKKLLATLALAASSTTFAADFVSVDVDTVKGRDGQGDSTAQYIRIGKELGGLQFGLQSRTAKVDGGGLLSSFETTVASPRVKVLGITPFIGVGHDQGFNGASGGSYNYGLVGATAGAKVGPGFALVGVKTRVGSTEQNNTRQTVAFGTYSVPVAKNVAVNLNVSRSDQDIKENAYGLGLQFNF